MSTQAIKWVSKGGGPIGKQAMNKLADLWPEEAELKFVYDKIRHSEWQMLIAYLQGAPVAWLVLSTEETPRGRVLLVNGLIGAAKDHDLTREADTLIDHLAQLAGANLVRFWTTRSGLVAKLQFRGWQQSYVMERPVYGF